MSELKFDFSEMRDRLLFLIQIDGLSHSRFKEMLGSSQLPNMASLLDRLPGSVGRVVSTFPAATAPSLPEMLTGRWCRNFLRHPRKINAFDRLQKKALKYEFIPEAWSGELIDIFDIYRQHDDFILSFFPGQFNSAAATYHDSISAGLDAIGKFSGREGGGYDQKVLEKLIEFFDKGDSYPRFVFMGMGGLDLVGHFQGPDSDMYVSTLKETDQIIGKLVTFLENRKDEKGNPLFDKSIFVIFGDHGIVQSEKYIDIAAKLKEEGLKVSDLGSIGHLVAEKINPFWEIDREILSAPGGSNITELYVRRKHKGRALDWDEFCVYPELRNYQIQNWFQEGKIDLVSFIESVEGVGEIIVGVCENVVRVFTPGKGVATIFRRPGSGSDTFAYKVEDSSSGVDPFGYVKSPAAVDLVCFDKDIEPENWVEGRFDGYFHSLRDWVKATMDTEYPAAVPLIPKAFSKHQTTSDIIINAEPPYNFSRFFHGDHGILKSDSVTTAMLIAGPGVKNGGMLDGMLLIDALPTLLKLLNINPPSSFVRFLDGKSHDEIVG